MFINSLLKFIGGQIEVLVSGGNIERFLNLLNNAQIKIWDIKRKDIGSITFHMYKRNFKHIRYAVRKTGVKVHIQHKSGMPFTTYKYRKRYGIVAGAALFLCALYIMSLFVWVIEVEGNVNVSSDDILLGLKESGFKVGIFRPSTNVNEIENKYLINNDKISWVSINIKGTTATVEVTERTQAPEIIDMNTPCSIYAARDGVIESIIDYNGQKLVNKGDTVRAGDEIVTGEIVDKHGVRRVVHAMAEVMATTYRTHTVTKKLSYQENERTGNQKNKYTLNLMSFKLPLYFSKKISYNNYDVTTSQNHLTLFRDFALPISLTKTSYIEVTPVTKTITKQEAIEQLKLEMQHYEQQLYGITIKDKTEKITESDNEVTLTTTFECLEDIAIAHEIE